MEEYLKKLGINEQGKKESDGSYVIEFIDDTDANGNPIPGKRADDKWAFAYTKLDRAEDIDEDEDSSNIAYDNSSVFFENDAYTIALLIEDNKYKLVMREN